MENVRYPRQTLHHLYSNAGLNARNNGAPYRIIQTTLPVQHRGSKRDKINKSNIDCDTTTCIYSISVNVQDDLIFAIILHRKILNAQKLYPVYLPIKTIQIATNG